MEKKKLKLRDLHQEEDLKLKELMEIHGGEDEDEDCYAQQCVVSMLFCISDLNRCYYSM